MDSKEKFTCAFVKPNGRTCDKQFTRAWNLQRHIQKQHARKKPQQPKQTPLSVVALPLDPPEATALPVDPPNHPNLPCNVPQSINVDHQQPQPNPSDSFDTCEYVCPTRSEEGAVEPLRPASELGTCGDTPHSSGGAIDDLWGGRRSNDNNCKRPTSWRGRPTRMALERFPAYDIRTSRKYPLQQKALPWLSHSAYEQFHEYWERILNSWGVRAGHRSTCILVPADWIALDPAELVPKFSQSTCPKARMDRPFFHYEDHQTSISRAVAWFSKWPRSGGELDVFLGCGPFKPMDGSHTCHHENCIVHVCYEPSDINIDRMGCHERARFLRSENRAIPECCVVHDPPCLLQLASLTTFEVYLIQFAVLCRGRGLAQLPAPPRPRWHPYRTFETKLPLSAGFGGGSSLQYDEQPLTEYNAHVNRPALVCKFCPTIKSFSRVTPLWSHLVRAHDDVNTADRLSEVSWSASVWREYWEKVSDGGRRDGLTMQRLAQAVAGGFTWKHVLDWGLR